MNAPLLLEVLARRGETPQADLPLFSEGVMRYVWESRFGLMLIEMVGVIDHLEGAYTVYGHLDALKVAEDANVQAGQQVGTVGYSGNAKTLKAKGLPPHLHFALIIAGQTGLADKDKPLRKMKEWGDFWKANFDAQLTGAVDPVLFMQDSKSCWTGSTTVGAPGEN